MNEENVWEPVDYETVWAPFDARFRFRPSFDASGWPGFDEPEGCVVFSLVGCFDGSGSAEWLRQAVNFTTVWALTVVSGQDPLYALDWQHQTYRFWPRRIQETEPSSMLGMNRINPVPNGDYYCFVSQDLSYGTLGHPWEETLCVFGEALMQVLVPALQALLPIARQR